jgi:hypothetical protein
MKDFRNKQIKELVKMVQDAGLGKCHFEFYMNSETKPRGLKVNRNVEKTLMFLRELRSNFGLAYRVKDTNKMNPKEVKDAYRISVYWIQNPRRPYGTSRRIYEIFAGGEAGDRFGKEIPAMIAYDSSGNVLFVLPHEVEGYAGFSLHAYTLKQSQSSREEAVLTICDFLQGLLKNL